MLHDGATPTDSNAEEEAAEGEEHLVVRGGEPRVHPGHVSGLPGVGIQCTRGGGLQLQQEQRGQNVRFRQNQGEEIRLAFNYFQLILIANGRLVDHCRVCDTWSGRRLPSGAV